MTQILCDYCEKVLLDSELQKAVKIVISRLGIPDYGGNDKLYELEFHEDCYLLFGEHIESFKKRESLRNTQ